MSEIKNNKPSKSNIKDQDENGIKNNCYDGGWLADYPFFF